MADLGGIPVHAPPPSWPNFLHFHVFFFWKNWQNRMLVPPGGLVLPLAENPGSSPGRDSGRSRSLPKTARNENY